ncbi:ATP synthase F1 subcomplex gamma subunit [Thermoflavifilum aggregans]|uniref:ATP synthase gamma chain n=1 Tax=Thermoflavifilum aggregans TaxID=454188 RepID=A0A2M9CST8_9BACT|nr:ATP synthase F1 subunit gamma [Thermoflavifilum aggregans]PJJ74915.1 ATP synthase F1 subcomplex gamma subunit [Thermoflavifilum aggregans]
MPGKLKEVRNRIKSVQSTQQITKAMKMVSAAKLRRAQDAIIQMRPYARKLQELLQHIVQNYQGDAGRKYITKRPVEKVLIVVITSDRGLCGAYNANLIRLAKQLITEKYAAQQARGNVYVMPVGKKGYDHFVKYRFQVIPDHWRLFHELNFETVREAAQTAVQGFLNHRWDVVELVYSEFKNAASQRFVVERFLPVEPAQARQPQTHTNFLFEPNEDQLIEELIPKILNTQFFKAILDAHASEHGARMTAMDKASENASEILKTLRISYNRARQAAITTELTEIVSGAAALKG